MLEFSQGMGDNDTPSQKAPPGEMSRLCADTSGQVAKRTVLRRVIVLARKLLFGIDLAVLTVLVLYTYSGHELWHMLRPC